MEIVTFKQRYDAENAVFFESLDAAALQASAKKVDKLSKNEMVDADLKERCEALSFRLRAKRYALLYFGDYSDALYGEAVAFLGQAAAVCEQKNYAKTLASLNALRSFFERSHPLLADSDAWLSRVYDSSGRAITRDPAVLAAVRDAFRQKAADAANLEREDIFVRGVRMPDLKERLISDLQFECERAEKLLEGAVRERNDSVLREYVRPLKKEYGTDFIEYYPLLGDGESKPSGTLVLNTPFLREAQLAVIKWAEARGREALSVRASAFSDLDAERVSAVVSLLGTKNADLLVSGLLSYRNEGNKAQVIRELVALGRSGAHVYLLDEEGTNRLYEEVFAVAKDSGSLSALDVGFYYLTMPYYRDVLSLLTEKEVISDEAQLKEIAPQIAFMGYEGLNAAMRAYAQGNNWRETAYSYSLRNAERAKQYFQSINAQYQLLDTAWGDFSEFFSGRLALEKRKEIDYDDIKMRNPANVRKILESNMTIFEKCGAISRYCTLYGDDVSVWASLSLEEMSERVTEATQLVMRTLGVPLLPVVEILSLEDWKKRDCNATAGGLCCNGGKLILYREDCSRGYDWMISAICHECYHAFQHMAIGTGWKQWYYTELGVTAGRLPEWEYNSHNYFTDTKSKGYRVEVMESDARAFEHDCVNASAAFWNQIDFE